MNIDWDKTLINWSPSEKAVEIQDRRRVNLIVCFLEMFGNQELLDIEVGYRRFPETFYAVRDCGFCNYGLASEAARQLRGHLRVWETHLDEESNIAIEFPMAVRIDSVLYYFKMIIYLNIEFKLENFEEINKIEISFHQNKNATRIST